MVKSLGRLGCLFGNGAHSTIKTAVYKEVTKISSNKGAENVRRFIEEAKKGGMKKGFVVMSLMDMYIVNSKNMNGSAEKDSKNGEWLDYLSWYSNELAEIRANRLIIAALLSTSTVEEAIAWLELKLKEGHFCLEKDEEKEEEDNECSDDTDSLLNRLVSPSVPIFEEERTIPSQIELK